MTIATRDTTRPSSQHRLSMTSMATSLPSRNSYSRSHSHAVTVGSGSYNPTHRVTRRKSTNLNAATSAAAISTAINIESSGDGDNAGKRRSASSKALLGSLTAGSYPSPPSSMPQQAGHYPGPKSSSVVADGSDKIGTKARNRRASEASAAGPKKRVGHGELKCETCGKGYKHSSCLTKHLWEHTPEWQYTSKLLISKHQQVQLLEAASVLMKMNEEGEPSSDGAKMSDSEQSSASPEASGFDSREDEPSSAETTPPPLHERSVFRHHKHDSTSSSLASRSYQSNISESMPQHDRHWSTSSSRPASANTSITQSYGGEDQADLAAAVGLLSCSYGTPKSGSVTMPSDVPPVPPLPLQYQNSYQPSSLSKSMQQRYDDDDVDMDEDSYSDDDEPDHRRSGEVADEGVFGMEE